MRWAYLHGFASSPLSAKGVWLAERFAEGGLELERPDLNQPDFARLTWTGALAELDRLHAARPQERWCLIGSSMGGYLAARWAALHPQRVDRLMLLCPGFDLLERWPGMLGEALWERWQREGTLEYPDGTGAPVAVHWGFVEDARRHPGRPAPRAPVRILHGRQDRVVPIEGSRRFVREHPDARLIEVDDDHRLGASVDRILAETLDHFGL